MCALKNVKEVELMGMPKLKKCVLMGGLKNVKSVKMENAGKFESVKGLQEVVEEERKKKEEEEKKKREKEEKREREKERKEKEMEDRRRREEEEGKRREEEMGRKREMYERRRREERKKREEEERKKREEEERKKKGEEERKRKEEAERKKREEEREKREEMNALARTTGIIRSVSDLKKVNCSVLIIVIASNCCNDGKLSVLDMSRFMNLRELKVGDECFENVKEVKLIGLNQLESVMIEKNSFTKYKNDWPNYDSPRHFYLKNCERVRELKIGRCSFSDYSVCEIENVPSLEVIEMGKLNKWSYNFKYASLELKSVSERME